MPPTLSRKVECVGLGGRLELDQVEHHGAKLEGELCIKNGEETSSLHLNTPLMEGCTYCCLT